MTKSRSLTVVIIMMLVMIGMFAFAESADAASAKIKKSKGWQYKAVKGGVAVLGFREKKNKAKVPKRLAGKRVKEVRVDFTEKTSYKCEKLTIPSYVAQTKIGNSLDSDGSRIQKLDINSKKITGKKRDGFRFGELTIGTKVRSIGKYSFYFVGLDDKRLTIKKGVRSIGSYAFYCSGLSKATLPKTVTKIGKSAFGDNFDFRLYGSSAATRKYVKKYKLNLLKKSKFEFKQVIEDLYSMDKEHYDVFAYTGNEVKPSVKSYYKTSEYKVSYSGNIEIGKAKATITGRGYYEGSSVAKTFIVAPPKIETISTDLGTSGDDLNKLQVSWDAVHGATSYRVEAIPTGGKDVKMTTSETSTTLILEANKNYSIYVSSLVEIGGKTYSVHPSELATVRTL